MSVVHPSTLLWSVNCYVFDSNRWYKTAHITICRQWQSQQVTRQNVLSNHWFKIMIKMKNSYIQNLSYTFLKNGYIYWFIIYPFILLKKYIANYSPKLHPLGVQWVGSERLWDSSIYFIIFVLEIFLMGICFEYVINNMSVIQMILESLNVLFINMYFKTNVLSFASL